MKQTCGSIRQMLMAIGVLLTLSGAAQALTIDQAAIDPALGDLAVAESDAGNTLILVSLFDLADGEVFSFDDLAAEFISATTFTNPAAPTASLVGVLAGDPSDVFNDPGDGVLVAPPGGPATFQFQPLGSPITGAMDIAQVQTPSVEIFSGANILFNALYLEVSIPFTGALAEGVVLTVNGETLASSADDLIVVQRISEVPLPGALGLLLAGLGGLLVLRGQRSLPV